MIRKRFPASRVRRLLGWTSLALAWSTAFVARGLAAPPASTAESAPPPATLPATATEVTSTLPSMPEGGLVILRYTPAPKPAAEVRRVVVTRAPAATAVSPAPVATSSGS